MGNPTGFMDIARRVPKLRDPLARVKDFKEHPVPLDVADLRKQASRCMDCGVPFCMSGCPLGNVIPQFNDHIYQDQWQQAIDVLHSTNNFPEFTGRVCPAPCESACVAGLNGEPVTIKQSEAVIADKILEDGFLNPAPTLPDTAKTVGVVGAGPAGLACAQQLRRAGHQVRVYEKAPRAGGLLTYGIPEYKLPKDLVQIRVQQLMDEGVEFKFGVEVGEDMSLDDIHAKHDAVVLALGSQIPRDLKIPGREATGIHFAMDFLANQTSDLLAEPYWHYPDAISAEGKNVIVIGGGDTGSDCIGTALRQGAKSVVNFELMPKHPTDRSDDNPWPEYSRIYRVSSSMEENLMVGGSTEYSILTEDFCLGESGELTGVTTTLVQWHKNSLDGSMHMVPVADSRRVWKADLVLLALGYVGPKVDALVQDMGVQLDKAGQISTDDQKRTTREGLFAAGDCRRGQSLIVWAIAEGRDTASSVDSFLTGRPSELPKVKT